VTVFTFCWAAVELVGAATGVSAYEVVWTRYGIHLAVVALLFGPRHGANLVRSREPLREVLCSLLMLGMPLCFIWALSRMTLSDALAVFWTAPLLIIVIVFATGGQYGGPRTVIATVAGLLGALLIYRPDLGVLRPAAGLAFGMALCFSFYVVGMRAIRRDPVLVKLSHTALWVFVALSLVQPFIWHTPTLRGFAAMALIGMLGLVGLYALDTAIEAASPAIIAPLFYTQLVWEILLQSRLHLMHQPREIAGLVLILLAVVVAFTWRALPTLPDVPPSARSRESHA
jgi:drug/metabolite transporter (DMT)-like permease